jgi:predicted nucleic acid-binding protein
MMQGKVVDLSATLALNAARLSAEESMPMADAMIYATAQAHDATLWTQDVHFQGKRNVQYRAAKQR